MFDDGFEGAAQEFGIEAFMDGAPDHDVSPLYAELFLEGSDDRSEHHRLDPPTV